MSRYFPAGVVAFAAISLAACTEAPVSPNNGPDVPQAISLGMNAAKGEEQILDGELIVKLKDGADAAAVAGKHGLSVSEKGYKNAFVIMKGNAGTEKSKAKELASDSQVEYAEPNYLRQIDAIDPRLWAFYNPGGLNMSYTSGGTGTINSSYASFADADEDNVENYAAGGSPVVIGSIDTGVNMSHPEFTGRLIAGRDWYNKNDFNPEDEDGHGSHTTGTMAGTNVGVAGVSGAAANVRVYVQRVCGRRGCPTSAIVNAIRAAADYPGMVAMNLSLGGSSESQAEKDAITYATGKNVLVIASAGNGSTGTVSCPACDPNSISVASSSWQDKLAYYSNWGSGLDITAPGGQCYSNTTPEGCIYSAYKGGGYAWLQGTSMAAPQVTGTAGIVASKHAVLRGALLRDQLLSTADDLGTAGYDTFFGAGRLNSYRAVIGTTLPAGQ